MPEMMLELLPDKYAEQYAAMILKDLPGKKNYNEFVRVFMEWCKSPFDSSDTAQRLNVHRNTLQYRLKKLKTITGKDPRRFRDAFELWTAFVIKKSMDEKRKKQKELP